MARHHKSRAPKHVYSLHELHFSDNWCTEDFRLAEKQRELDRDKKKEQNCENVGIILELIDSENIRSFSKLVRLIYQHHSNLRSVLLGNSYFLRDYLRSLSNDELEERIASCYDDHKDLELQYQVKFEEFQAEMQEKIAFRESQVADLEVLLNKLIKRPEHVAEPDKLKSEWQEFEQEFNLNPVDADKYLF